MSSNDVASSPTRNKHIAPTSGQPGIGLHQIIKRTGPCSATSPLAWGISLQLGLKYSILLAYHLVRSGDIHEIVEQSLQVGGVLEKTTGKDGMIPKRNFVCRHVIQNHRYRDSKALEKVFTLVKQARSKQHKLMQPITVVPPPVERSHQFGAAHLLQEYHHT
ncbi:hypothetical protein F511_03946 [Dorcoceras hygrometricum]|uniref:Uncharacterized protein n=1 Tax=Dorcoceras hygrometricum TaxID=472368 RepID=A0A2Z7BZK3_9LAMI|nr:hypothetical protein F511_03946 [Dorcoceras hygrometricum]